MGISLEDIRQAKLRNSQESKDGRGLLVPYEPRYILMNRLTLLRLKAALVNDIFSGYSGHEPLDEIYGMRVMIDDTVADDDYVLAENFES